jgi:hypothetical protein
MRFPSLLHLTPLLKMSSNKNREQLNAGFQIIWHGWQLLYRFALLGYD